MHGFQCGRVKTETFENADANLFVFDSRQKRIKRYPSSEENALVWTCENHTEKLAFFRQM